MSKKKVDVAEPVIEPDQAEELDQEAVADPAVVELKEPEPVVATEPTPVEFSDEQLGIPALGMDGQPLDAAGRAAVYNVPDIEWCRKLATRVGVVDENLLWDIARSFRATVPDRWRHALLEHLHRRESGIETLTSDEVMSRFGLTRGPEKQLAYLRQRFQQVVESVTPERAIRLYEAAIHAAVQEAAKGQ